MESRRLNVWPQKCLCCGDIADNTGSPWVSCRKHPWRLEGLCPHCGRDHVPPWRLEGLCPHCGRNRFPHWKQRGLNKTQLLFCGQVFVFLRLEIGVHRNQWVCNSSFTLRKVENEDAPALDTCGWTLNFCWRTQPGRFPNYKNSFKEECFVLYWRETQVPDYTFFFKFSLTFCL